MLEYVFIVCVIMTGNTLADNNKLMTSRSLGESGVFVVNSHSGSGSAMVYATADYSLKD